MIADEPISLGGKIRADDSTNAARPRMPQEFAQHHRFDAAPKDAATHEPGVDLPVRGPSPADDYADHAVVAEFVDQSNLDGKDCGIGFQRRYVEVTITAGRQVELIGFVDELRYTASSVRFEG